MRGLGITFLFALAVGLLASLFPHDPSECGEPPHIEDADTPNIPPPAITQVVSPGTVVLFNGCPGNPARDFKPR
jgi:hypothetical protein